MCCVNFQIKTLYGIFSIDISIGTHHYQLTETQFVMEFNRYEKLAYGVGYTPDRGTTKFLYQEKLVKSGTY